MFEAEDCVTVIKHPTRDYGIASSILKSSKCSVLEQDTLSTLLITGFNCSPKE